MGVCVVATRAGGGALIVSAQRLEKHAFSSRAQALSRRPADGVSHHFTLQDPSRQRRRVSSPVMTHTVLLLVKRRGRDFNKKKKTSLRFLSNIWGGKEERLK